MRGVIYNIGFLTAATAACSAPAPSSSVDRSGEREHAGGAEGFDGERRDGISRENEDLGVAGLPFARGRTFYSLDEYLAHLEQLGAVDLPWWRQIRPGVYEHVTSMTGAERETATREELMQRFGFER